MWIKGGIGTTLHYSLWEANGAFSLLVKLINLPGGIIARYNILDAISVLFLCKNPQKLRAPFSIHCIGE